MKNETHKTNQLRTSRTNRTQLRANSFRKTSTTSRGKENFSKTEKKLKFV